MKNRCLSSAEGRGIPSVGNHASQIPDQKYFEVFKNNGGGNFSLDFMQRKKSKLENKKRILST